MYEHIYAPDETARADKAQSRARLAEIVARFNPIQLQDLLVACRDPGNFGDWHNCAVARLYGANGELYHAAMKLCQPGEEAGCASFLLAVSKLFSAQGTQLSRSDIYVVTDAFDTDDPGRGLLLDKTHQILRGEEDCVLAHLASVARRATRADLIELAQAALARAQGDPVAGPPRRVAQAV